MPRVCKAGFLYKLSVNTGVNISSWATGDIIHFTVLFTTQVLLSVTSKLILMCKISKFPLLNSLIQATNPCFLIHMLPRRVVSAVLKCSTVHDSSIIQTCFLSHIRVWGTVKAGTAADWLSQLRLFDRWRKCNFPYFHLSCMSWCVKFSQGSRGHQS